MRLDSDGTGRQYIYKKKLRRGTERAFSSRGYLCKGVFYRSLSTDSGLFLFLRRAVRSFHTKQELPTSCTLGLRPRFFLGIVSATSIAVVINVE